MRYLIVLLLTACAAPTAGDLRWMGSTTESDSKLAPQEAATCVLRGLAGMQGWMGTQATVAMRPRAEGAWEVEVRNPSGVTAHVLAAPRAGGSHITTREIGGAQVATVADGC
jgi:hypothetical protein